MVILLNGSINSGKTTIGHEILAMDIGFAHIEVDDLRHFISWMPLAQSIKLNLENAASVANNFNNAGIHSVITYPLSSSDYIYISRLLEGYGIEYVAITLFPGVENLKKNRGDRELTDWELSRIDELFEEGTATPDFGVTINNSDLSVKETAMAVLESAGFNKRLG